MNGRHEADLPPDGPPQDEESTDRGRSEEAEGAGPGDRRVKRHRRVRTDPVPGSDPEPQPEPPRHSSGENDERLRADKPPHWAL
jgi:hypothetical protein